MQMLSAWTKTDGQNRGRSPRAGRRHLGAIAATVVMASALVGAAAPAAADVEPLANTLVVVELSTPPGATYQDFVLTMTGAAPMCAEESQAPWWTGTECWYPDDWGGNFSAQVHPSLDGRAAMMRLGYDCWLDNEQDFAARTCSVRVSPKSFGLGATLNPLYFLGNTRYRGSDFSPSGGASQIVPVNWGKLFPGSEDNEPPVASFDVDPLPSPPRAFQFTNRSTDPEDSSSELTSSWAFGDGETSTDDSPSHTYAEPGTYTASLEVTDTGGLRSSTTRQVVVAGDPGLVVNSTGDGSADDVELTGCDTGGTIGADPECTLRAAIETTNATGGGEITFDIDAPGVPEISLGAPLPSLIADTSIDGTTQAGGFIEVSGGGETGFELSSGSSTLTGLVVNGSVTSVLALGGSDHQVIGNYLGTDATGTTADGTESGVLLAGGSGTTVADNVTGAGLGIYVAPEASGTEVDGNRVGLAPDGSTPLGDPEAAILVAGPDTTVRDNAVRGSTVGISVISTAAVGTSVEGNRVGTNDAGTAAVEGTGYGIRVDATPDVSITGNRVVADAIASIIVAGSAQATLEEDGSLTYSPPAAEIEGQPVTGGGVTIAGNTVGLVGASTVAGDAGSGIVSWAGAPRSTIDGNTIGGNPSLDGIEVIGGADHRVTGNRLGGPGAALSEGISLDGAATSTVGGPGTAANTIVSSSAGIAVDGSRQVRLEGNQITGEGAFNAGVQVADDAIEPTIVGNAISGGRVGVDVESIDATISSNSVSDVLDTGIASTGDGGTIEANTVVGGGGDGIVVGGDAASITTNRVGLPQGSNVVDGVGGSGIAVVSGQAQVSRNVVAGSGADGIAVGPESKATLRSNRIWQSVDDPISVVDGPAAPTLDAAIRTGSGDTLRTTLLITDLPDGDAGTIEVFANESCGDPEAEFLMEINRVKDADETVRIIQIRGNESRDDFTLSYTDESGRTSELSNCSARATYGDSDGDGVVDPIDGAVGDQDQDPTMATLATDSEDLLLMMVAPFDEETGTGGGQFENLSVTDDPDPTGHGEGWTLPYGAIRFRVSGLAPGGRTSVVMVAVSGSDPIAGTSYWKYGPQVAGGPSGWYDFALDGETGTGATLSSGVDIPGLGLRRAFVLSFEDGGRGDSDGGANGSITDPGGPVVGATPSAPEVPSTPTPSTLTEPTVPGSASPTSPTSPAPAVGTGTIVRTGSESSGLVTFALVLLGAGVLFVAFGRKKSVGPC